MADGWQKNLERFREDLSVLRSEMPAHMKRYALRPWDMHAYVNLYVESRRAAPYLVGHVDSVMYPLLVILAIL